MTLLDLLFTVNQIGESCPIFLLIEQRFNATRLFFIDSSSKTITELPRYWL